MCGEAYNPDEVTDKTKINGVTAAWEAPPNVGRGGRIWVTRGDTYMEESDIGANLRRYTEVPRL